MRWDRQQYLDLMTFKPVPRPMFSELFGPLIGLEENWRAQGASDAEINMVGFDWDYVPTVGGFAHTGIFGGQPRVVLEESDTHRLERDALGRTLQLDKRTATIPLPMDFPVRNMDDWLRLKPLFQFRPERLNWDKLEAAKIAQTQGALVVVGIPGAFDMARELMGEELACLAYYDQPELMQDILATLQDTALRVLEPLSAKITIDQLSVHEDFAGRSGPLVGPDQIATCFKPYYRAVWDLLRSRGCQLFGLDTDGNINPVLEPLLDTGLNCMHPMEPAAGMDIVHVRQQCGSRLAMSGGINKFALTRGRDAIRQELEYKLQPSMRAGTVFGLDHRIPAETPLEAYRYYVQTGREILGLPPLDGKRQGWGRMAF